MSFLNTKNGSTRNWRGLVAPAVLLFVFLAMRLPGLGTFVTTDEALWLRRSANFYYAIAHSDWANTYQSEHPGVVAQWAGAAGYWWKFPEYAQVGAEGNSDFQLRRLMLNRGINPMEVLAAGRLAMVLVHAAAFTACWPFARRLLGFPAAFLGLGLIALDPFLIAHQRLLHQDGLLSSFMLLGVLAYADHLQSGKRSALITAGVAAGLAWLTKTPGWVLLPVFAAMTAWKFFKSTERKNSRLVDRSISLLVWGGICLVVLFVLYPAMWTAPLEIFSGMFGYAQGTAEGEFSGPVFFNGNVYPDGNLGAAGRTFYPLSYLWRSTPLTLIGLAAAAWALPKKEKPKDKSRFGVWSLLFFAVSFGLAMTIAEKKFDRYMLPAFPALMLVAGWGWAKVVKQVSWLKKPEWRGRALIAGVLVLQLLSALPTQPYYLSYYNPLLGGTRNAPQVMMIGWGEGLDQAAAYLNAQPDSEQLQVASWYSSSFNLMFSGDAEDIPIALDIPEAQLQSLLSMDYLVIYVHQWQRGTPANLLDVLRTMEPEHNVAINGIEYVRIYRLSE